jgi:hypothetical protein
VPYYLLLVGGPDAIPFDFQYTLDIDYAVGRLCFDTAEEYHCYADSVVAYETAAAVPNAREVVYWATRHDGPGQDRDPATQLSADWLVTPLAEGVPARDDQPAEDPVAARVQYARLSHELTLLREAAPGSAPPSDADPAYAWLECADYQNYVLLGDPAVRLRVPLLQ